MSLNAIKSRLGSISPTKLDAIYTLSKSAHAVLQDVPKLIAVADAAKKLNVQAYEVCTWHEYATGECVCGFRTMYDALVELEQEK